MPKLPKIARNERPNPTMNLAGLPFFNLDFLAISAILAIA
jgi:hypothetical protein